MGEAGTHGSEACGGINMDVMRTIQLPADLCEAAEKKFSGRFGSVEELLEVTLRELLRDGALKMDEHEQQIIEERLRALGYV
jgi:hypothetical protein